jgi:hypothetical protein
MAPSNRRYYKGHPEYHMYLHRLSTYDAKSPQSARSEAPENALRGCHVASIEGTSQAWEGRFPNAAVDLAARIDDLQLLDRDAVRAFFIIPGPAALRPT